MKRTGLVAVMLLACSHSSKPHSTTGKFEDCYYDCKSSPKPGAAVVEVKGSGGGGTAGAPAAPPPAGKLTPAGEKAQNLRDAADNLEKADAALQSGNKNRAELLFSTAE